MKYYVMLHTEHGMKFLTGLNGTMIETDGEQGTPPKAFKKFNEALDIVRDFSYSGIKAIAFSSEKDYSKPFSCMKFERKWRI